MVIPGIRQKYGRKQTVLVHGCLSRFKAGQKIGQIVVEVEATASAALKCLKCNNMLPNMLPPGVMGVLKTVEW